MKNHAQNRTLSTPAHLPRTITILQALVLRLNGDNFGLEECRVVSVAGQTKFVVWLPKFQVNFTWNQGKRMFIKSGVYSLA